MRPAHLENRLRRELVGRLKAITRSRILGIKKDHLATAPALVRVGACLLVGQEILQRAEEESTELSALRIGLGHCMFLLQVEAKRLHQIFRVLISITAPTHVRVKRIPVRLKKLC